MHRTPHAARACTIPEFLRWFDAVRAGTEPAARTPMPVEMSQAGQFYLSIGDDGSVRIQSSQPASRPGRP